MSVRSQETIESKNKRPLKAVIRLRPYKFSLLIFSFLKIIVKEAFLCKGFKKISVMTLYAPAFRH